MTGFGDTWMLKMKKIDKTAKWKKMGCNMIQKRFSEYCMHEPLQVNSRQKIPGAKHARPNKINTKTINTSCNMQHLNSHTKI